MKAVHIPEDSSHPLQHVQEVDNSLRRYLFIVKELNN